MMCLTNDNLCAKCYLFLYLYFDIIVWPLDTLLIPNIATHRQICAPENQHASFQTHLLGCVCNRQLWAFKMSTEIAPAQSETDTRMGYPQSGFLAACRRGQVAFSDVMCSRWWWVRSLSSSDIERARTGI